MQNATRPGFAAPMPIPPQIPRMPNGYAPPVYPQVIYANPPFPYQAVNRNNGTFKKISNNPLFSYLIIFLIALFALYAFFQTEPGKKLADLIPFVARTVELLAAATGFAYLYKNGGKFYNAAKSAAGFASEAKGAAAIAEEAKGAAAVAEEAKGAAAVAEEAKGAAAVAEEARGAAAVAEEVRGAKGAATSLEELANFAKFL